MAKNQTPEELSAATAKAEVAKAKAEANAAKAAHLLVVQERILDDVRVWSKNLIVRLIMNDDTNDYRAEIVALRDLAEKARVKHDEVARKQGHETIRGQKEIKATEEVSVEDAERMADELIG